MATTRTKTQISTKEQTETTMQQEKSFDEQSHHILRHSPDTSSHLVPTANIAALAKAALRTAAVVLQYKRTNTC